MEPSKFRLDDFELYQIAREFRKKIYRLAKRLPDSEKFCLNPQMRRAALSVSNNIAEGHGRWHFQDNVRFCLFSRGSVEEVIDDLNVCLDESYDGEALLSQLKQKRTRSFRASMDICRTSANRNRSGDLHHSPLTPHHTRAT